MEASQQGPSDPQDQPTTASQQDTDQAAVSQEQPTQDSQLTTPQADQPVPTEAERQSDPQGPAPTLAEAGPSGQAAEGTVTAPSYPTSQDQVDAEARRQAERDAQRQLHNERTGGGQVTEGEVDAQRDEHNARVSGESVDDSQQAESAPAQDSSESDQA